MSEKRHVGLFATCLVDMFRPEIGFAAISLLERAGCRISVPAQQTCCGQPALNSGDAADARDIARQVIEHFEAYDYVVLPSGSCAATMRVHYPKLFQGDPAWSLRAGRFADKVYELTSFLTDVCGFDEIDTTIDAPTVHIGECTVTYHDSCSGLRELSIKDQPRALLAKVKGLQLTEMDGAETCCGFGGAFCIKYPEISNAIVSEKVENIAASGAELLLGGDLGCLMNMAGKLSRRNLPIRVLHVAEILAGKGDKPGIGEKD